MGNRKIRESKQALSYMAAMATVLIWAAGFPATRYLLQHYSPGVIMLQRYSLAAATMVGIGIIKKIRLPEIKDIPSFALFGVCGIFLYNFFFNTGTVHVVAGVSSFIVASAPVFVLITARLVLKETVKSACWVGVLLSFCGLVVVALSQMIGYSLNIGIFLLIGAAAASSVLSVAQRKLVRKYTVIEATTYGFLFAVMCMMVYMPNLVRELPRATLTTNLIVVFMGIFHAVVAYLTWGYALSKAEKTTHVTVFLYLVPFLASAIGYIWLGETFSLWALLGGVIVIAGMI